MKNKQSAINHYFDKVYVLNLEGRPDRKVLMLQKLMDLGIEAEFVQAINGNCAENKSEFENYFNQPIGEEGSHYLEIAHQKKLIGSPGAWGYLKTYFRVLEDAKKSNYQRILVFDDDVLFHKDFEKRFEQAVENILNDWKLLYLGASQHIWKIPEGLSYPDAQKNKVDSSVAFYFPANTDGSFATGIDASIFDLLQSEILRMNCPFDSGPLRRIQIEFPEKCFVLNPNLVIADVSESDIREGREQIVMAKKLRWNLDNYDFDGHHDLVSVIMPVFNGAASIEKAIQSILKQTYSHFELIVADDASTDRTVEIVQEIAKLDRRIRLFSLENNGGVGNARNAALRIAKGKIIAIQDADDISHPDRLARQMIPLYEKGVLFTVSRIFRSHLQPEEINLSKPLALWKIVEQQQEKNEAESLDFKESLHVGLITTVFKRAVFEQYGIFETHRFGEDLEFIERLLFYTLGEKFDEQFNGHSYLNYRPSVVRIFERIDNVLLISVAETNDNLTAQYKLKLKENQKNRLNSREKIYHGDPTIFEKLPVLEILSKRVSRLHYNTLKILDFEIKSGTNQVDDKIIFVAPPVANLPEEVLLLRREIGKIHRSISWKISAPIRWFGLGILKMKKMLNQKKKH